MVRGPPGAYPGKLIMKSEPRLPEELSPKRDTNTVFVVRESAEVLLSPIARSGGVVYGFCVLADAQLTIKCVGADSIISGQMTLAQATFGPGWHFVLPTTDGWTASTDVQVSVPPPVEPVAPLEG